MTCSITAQDIMDFLQGYCLDTLIAETSETITASETTNLITVGGGTAYATGDMIRFTATTSVPSPLVSGTTYFLIKIDSTTYKVALSRADADAGTAIDLTTAGTGTVTMTKYDYPYASRVWIESRINNFIVPYVERVTRQSLCSVKSVTEYYSGNGKNILILNRKPIVEVTEIKYVLGGNNLTILNLDNIEVVTSEGILKAKRNYEEAYYLPVFAKGDYNIEVTYTYGNTSIPDQIKEAVIYLSAEQLLGFLGSATGGGGLSMQSFSRNYGSRGKWQDIRNDLARQAHALLSPYMTEVVGN